MGPRRLGLGVLLSLAVGVVAFALRWVEPDVCGGNLVIIRRADPAAKVPLAKAAENGLGPNADAVHRALDTLPPDRQKYFRAKLGARGLSDDEHDSLVDEIVNEAD
jgi:hypothetical protein